MIQQVRRIPTEIQPPQTIAPEWNRLSHSRIDRERTRADHGIARRIAKARGGNAERSRVEPFQQRRAGKRRIAGLIGALGVYSRNVLAGLILRKDSYSKGSAGIHGGRAV